MGARRRAFALMLVLAATSMVFALAISGAVALRSATIEASAMHDRDAMLRRARSAIAVAMSGLTASAGTLDDLYASDNPEGGSGDDEPSSVDELDLPPFPSGLPIDLGSNPDESDGDSGGAGDTGSGSASSKKSRPRGALSALRDAGLPQSPVVITIEGVEHTLRFEDALGGLDLNRADEQRCVEYFVQAGCARSTAVEIAHQIIDWRDEDDFRRPQGAERDDYRSRGIVIRNGKFQTVEEALYLPSMTSEIFQRVRDDLCVGSDGRTYIGASAAALLAVPGMTGSAVRAIEARRSNGGPITTSELRDLLGLAADTAGPSLRTTPSDRVRVIVEPSDRQGVRLVGEVMVSDRRGVRIGAVSLR